MNEQTADEQQAKYTAKMGDKLGVQFHWLRQETIYLFMKWIEYAQLLGHSTERIALLNKVSGIYFRHQQDILWDDILLHIARMVDSPKSMGVDNLTLKNLPSLIADKSLHEKIVPLIENATKLAQFCRDWRHKLLAHKDLAHVINGTAHEIKGGSRDEVNAVLDAFAEILNIIEGHFGLGNTVYRFDGNSGVPSLLRVLERGLKGIEEDNQNFMAKLASKN